MVDERAQNGAFVLGLLHSVTSYRSMYCSLVQSTFDIRMDATVGRLQYSVDFSKFEAKNRSGSRLVNGNHCFRRNALGVSTASRNETLRVNFSIHDANLHVSGFF